MPRIATENQCGAKHPNGTKCTRQKGHPQPDKHKNKDLVWYTDNVQKPTQPVPVVSTEKPKKKRSQSSGLKLTQVVKAIEKMEQKQPGFTKAFISTMGKNKTPEDFTKRMKKLLKNVGD